MGWVFKIPALTSILPGLATMKANSALAFVLAAISLWLVTGEDRDQRSNLIAKVCATITMLIGLLTLGEYIFGWDFGIDQLLFQDKLAPQNAYPGRMSPATALNLFLLGCALLLIDNRSSNWLNESLTITALMIASVAVIGYIYSVSSLYQIGAYASMALHTAVTFILLCLGILCARPEHGFISILSTEGVAGTLARRLLPAAIGLPIVLGWLLLSGQRIGQYDTAFGIALFALLNVIIFSGLIRWNADMLHRSELERIQAQNKLQDNEKRYRRFFENMHETFVIQEIVVDNDGKPIDLRFLDLNPAAERMLGKTRSELIGRTRSELAGRPDPEGVEMASRVASTGMPFHMVRSSPGFGRSFESFTYSLGSGIVATLSLDITERKHAEETLRESEAHKSAILESALDCIITIDHQGRILEFNPAAQATFGYTRTEAIGKEMAELIIPPSLRERHRRGLAHYLSTGEGPVLGKRIEINGMRADGTEFPVELAITPIKGEDPPVFTGFLRDITESKRAEGAISASEERFRLIVEAAPSAMIAVDRDGKIDMVNAKAQELFGYRKEELLGRPVEILVPQRFRSGHAIYRQSFLAQPTGRPMGAGRDLFGLHKDGHEIPIEIGLTPYESSGSLFTLALIVDITERKQAEEALKTSQERFRLIVEAAPSAIIAVDAAGRINLVNKRAQELFGYPSEELLGRSVDILVPERFRTRHPDYRQSFVDKPSRRAMGAGRDLFGLHKDGREIPIEIGLTPYESSEGLFTLALVVDITERKRAEEELHKSEERYRFLFENNPFPMWVYDLKTLAFLAVNDSAVEKYGYTREEFLHTTIADIRPLEEVSRLMEDVAKQRPTLQRAGEWRHRLKDGTIIEVEITSHSLRIDEHDAALVVAIDITERKRAEEKIAYQAYLLENVNDAVIGSDENSYIRFWNQGAERILGWKAEEVLGRSGREILRSEFINIDRETVLKILAEQGRWKGEAILYHKDGSQVIMEVSSITLRDDNGMITGYVSVNRDITERKQAEERLQANAARALLIAELSQGLAELTDDYQRLLDLAARRIAELIGDYCAIRLVGADDVTMQLVVDHHLDASSQEFMHQFISSIPQRMDEGITAQVFRSGKAVLIPFVSPDAFRAQVKSEFHPLLERLNIHSVLIAPLRAEGKIIGTITMSRDQTPHAYTDDDQIFLQDLADRAALAIVSARLYTATRQLNAELEQRVADRTVALSQANSLLQMMLDHMPDQIYFKDAQSRFIRNSRSQAKALGLSDPAEAVGKSDFDFFSHAQQSYEKEQEIIRSGKPLVDLEEHVVWPDGQETWVSTTKVPLPDETGKIIGTFGISRDITDRKRTEKELQKAKLELEAANKELEAFSYSVSHDLRAPLRSVDGFSQALLEDYGEMLPPEGRNFLERIRNSAQRMAELIDDLLNLSKVTRASMKLVPVDLSQLAQGIVAELQRTHRERKVNFNITPNLKARGDPNLLQIVLENLLNNAWKFTSKREQAEIEFGSKPENDETIYFIRDNGAGFDMAYVSKLFGAFQRLHAMTEFSGTGIGLATVQRIINRHGGRIWAEGAVDQGATFFFTLPALKRARPVDVPQEKESLTKRVKEII